MKHLKIIFLLILIIGTFFIISRNEPYQKVNGQIFGTTYNITYKSKENLKNDIITALQNVDNSLSPFNKNSIISKINNNEEVVLDSMFTDVFNLAQKVSAATNGAFDITVAPVVNVWGFGFKKNINPDSATIDSLKKYIGYKSLSLIEGKIKKEHAETMLNCSAIAKGYACDILSRLFDNKGIDNYMIEIGGEMSLKGKNNKNSRWIIGVNKPTQEANLNNEMQTILKLTDCCIATSGNYRNYRYINGKKYSHTINPHTGYPVEHSLLSATVIAKECAYADALATAFMVMGMEKAIDFCKKNPDIESYFIYADKNGKLQTKETEGFKKYKK